MKGLGIAGFACSIAGLVICYVAWIGLVLSIAGLVLSIIASKKYKAAGQKNGLVTAGIVLGIVGIVLSGIFSIACTLCAAAVSEAAKESDLDWSELEDALSDLNG